MSRNAIITTVSGGYMFALNANFNTNKFFATNADYHVIYHDSIPQEYREACTRAFADSFEIRWIPMSGLNCDFHNSKYFYAHQLGQQSLYQAVCLIDADLFIIENLNTQFAKVYGTKNLISAQHLWSGGIKENLFNIPWEDVRDRMHAQLADFPLFIDPKKNLQFLQDWLDFTKLEPSKEISHPLVACNRSIAKNFKNEQVMVLDGHAWIADMDFWTYRYEWDRVKNILTYRTIEGEPKSGQVFACHNKWWKDGRANGEFRAHTWVDKSHAYYPRLLNGEHNFNEIKDMMAYFNNMIPATRRDDYLQERISMVAILEHLK